MFPIHEYNQTTFTELSKSQNIRLIDVFLIAPFMWYYAKNAKGMTDTEKTIMYGLAFATFYYNGSNYLANKKQIG